MPESAIESSEDEDDQREVIDSPEIERLRDSLRKYSIGKDPAGSRGPDSYPRFNRRPLSDTPVVSGGSSPSAFSPVVLSDDEDDDDDDDRNDQQQEEQFIDDDNNNEDDDKRSHQLAEKKRRDMALRLQTAENTLKNQCLSRHQPLQRKYSTGFNFIGQSKSKSSPHGTIESTSEKLVVVMVGLPARGKSYLSKKLVRYLNWLQVSSRIFNVGSTRRARSKIVGPASKPLPDKNAPVTAQDANFFSPANTENVKLREEWAMETLDHLLDYLLNRGGCVGVFDATNTTVQRRKMLFDTIKRKSHGNLKVLYLESICNDKSIIESNIRLKLDGPDYKNMDKEKALRDFKGRLANYEKVYESISDEEEKNREFQYIQMIDVGRKVIACNIKGFIPSQIIYYFLNFNLSQRLTFIARHGESTDNVLGKIGGDAPLTERGRQFAKALVRFVGYKKNEFRLKQLEEYQKRAHDKYYRRLVNSEDPVLPEEPHFQVLSSMMRRSVQTAEYFPEDEYEVKQIRALDELGSGKFDGMTYKQIQDQYPEEFATRLADKLTYRYPGMGGESYLDVINRLKPVINEMERSTNHMLLITHRVVSRILLAYFLNLKREAIGDLDVPLHSVYVFEPQPFGVEWKLYEYDEHKNWFYEVDPKKIKNSKKLKQVGISYRERQYSVVPTAPSNHSVSDSGISSSSSFRDTLREYSGPKYRHSTRLPRNNVAGDLQKARGIQ